MTARRMVRSTVALALVILGTLASAQAWDENRRMFLSFSSPVALPGVGLGAGSYIFELADPGGDPSIVRVLSRDRSTVYFMAFTELIPRPPRLRPDTLVSFGEAAPGRPVPIAVWYPPGDSSGRRFIYRKTSLRTDGVAASR